jgi:hypothetical protein
MQDLDIEDEFVTIPGTTLRAAYRKPHRGSQLVARLDYFQDQQRGPITRAEFLTRALKAATTKRASWGGLCRRATAGIPANPKSLSPLSEGR